MGVCSHATMRDMARAQQNIMRTYLYMALLTAVVMILAYVLSDMAGYGSMGVSVGLVVAGAINFIAYYFSDRVVLAQSGAEVADRSTHPSYYAIVEDLTRRADLPMPTLYVIPDSSLNAFATGRDAHHASVAVTRGLLSELDREELTGVIAHELSHIKNYDMRLMSTVSILVGMINILAQMFWYGGHSRSVSRDEDRAGGLVSIVLMMLTPIVGLLLQLAISRQREYLADASARDLAGSPQGLIRALEQMSTQTHRLHTAEIATAHLYITNPWGDDPLWSTLFSTHPPIKDRIRRLMSMDDLETKR